MEIGEKQGGNHKNKPIEKGASGSLNGEVSKGADLFRNRRISRPYDCSADSQNITHRVQAELCSAVEADQADSCHGYEKSQEETDSRLGVMQEQAAEYSGEKRCDGNDYADVRSQCKRQRYIFKEIIKRNSAEAGGGKIPFLFAVGKRQRSGAYDP